MAVDSQSALFVLACLLFELGIVAIPIFYLFRIRRRVGIGPLLVLLGSNQVLAVVLASTVYFEIQPGLLVSPGSAVLFTGLIAAALLVYLREDIPKTRSLLFAFVLVNASIFVLLWLTGYQMVALPSQNLLEVPIELFELNPRVMAAGTLALTLDVFLLAIFWEALRRSLPNLPRALRVLLVIVAVLCVDAAVFTTVAFWGSPNLDALLEGQLVTKVFFGVIWGGLLSAYLRWVEPIAVRSMQETGELAVFSILTYRERIEQVRMELEAERSANIAKTRFLAHMSHELRTPLNAILGFTKLLQSPSAPAAEDQRRLYLERVFDNGRHLLHLINGILDLSKIEAGKIDIHIEPVEVGSLVERTIEELRSQAAAKELALETHIPAGAVTLVTDPVRLKQIVINLVGNAIKFTHTGGVRIQLGESAHRWHLEVTDTGIGIPADQIDRVFEPFTQVEGGLSRRHPGTGLGLAITRALCEQLGFAISIDSREGNGTSIRVELQDFHEGQVVA